MKEVIYGTAGIDDMMTTYTLRAGSVLPEIVFRKAAIRITKSLLTTSMRV